MNVMDLGSMLIIEMTALQLLVVLTVWAVIVGIGIMLARGFWLLHKAQLEILEGISRIFGYRKAIYFILLKIATCYGVLGLWYVVPTTLTLILCLIYALIPTVFTALLWSPLILKLKIKPLDVT
jgi:hypothetical protein